MTRSFTEQKRKKLIQAVVCEIYESVQECRCGNYWISERYNIFCELGYTISGGRIACTYLTVNLEKYDTDGECEDCEIDSENTNSVSQTELKVAVTKIIERNEKLWAEI